MKLGFTGDISFDEFTKNYYLKDNLLDNNIKKFLKNNDYNIIDFESPITNSTKPTKKSLFHKCSEDTLSFIDKHIKNPIFVIGNNHMMDYGINGVIDTINTLNKKNYQFIGAGKDLIEASKYIVLEKDVKVALTSIQYKDFMISSLNNPGPMHESYDGIIKEQINQMKKNADYVVVVYHGGEEFLTVPMPYTRKILKKYLEYGADIVVAHHPHVVQGYEKIGKKYIFYSLGNFIFDTEFQRAQNYTDIGTLLSIDFNKQGFTFNNLDIFIDRVNEKIIKYNENSNFKEIKNNYNELWKNEIFRLTEIRKNKKNLKKTRVNLYLTDYNINKIVPFSYFKLQENKLKIEDSVDIKINESKDVIKKNLKKQKRKFKKSKLGKILNKFIRVLNEKKYRYYLVGKLHVILNKKR